MMSTDRDYHDIAVQFALLAIDARQQHQQERAAAYFEQALDFELAAIDQLDPSDTSTWAALHRTAATLAIGCRKFRQAEQITMRALSGDIDPHRAEELRSLLPQIYLQLADDELQLSLSGPELQRGLVQYQEIYGRADNASKLLYRIAERKYGLDFREGRQPGKAIREQYRTLIAAPRYAGSSALTLRFGSRVQPTLPGLFETADVIDEFMDLLALANDARRDAIAEIIPNPTYRQNFWALAKNLAPDGDRVRQVAFTMIRGDTTRTVELTTPARRLPTPLSPELSDAGYELATISGMLQYANADLDESYQIRIVDAQQKAHPVRVPTALMNDIVMPLWNTTVSATGVWVDDVIDLQDIRSDDSEPGSC